jgi:hypothetical protein
MRGSAAAGSQQHDARQGRSRSPTRHVGFSTPPSVRPGSFSEDGQTTAVSNRERDVLTGHGTWTAPASQDDAQVVNLQDNHATTAALPASDQGEHNDTSAAEIVPGVDGIDIGGKTMS